MPPKRKLASIGHAAAPAVKKKLQTTLPFANPVSQDVSVPTAPTEPFNYDEGIVNRKYYPPVLSNARCADYASGALTKPSDELKNALSSRTPRMGPSACDGQTVIHWFRTDLRVDDNTALSLAGKLAAAGSQTLIGLYIVSPQDWDAHAVSPARVDFLLRSLEVLKTQLERLDIPLWVEVVENRGDIPERIVRLCRQWGTKNVYANMEYEVDELRRDATLVRLAEKVGVAVEVVHDTCVVPPGELVTKVCVYLLFIQPASINEGDSLVEKLSQSTHLGTKPASHICPPTPLC
jgi:deoxyribodipyrimidine photo-lyase